MPASSRPGLAVLVLALVAVAAPRAPAATVAYLSDAQLAARASRIVEARVVARWTEVDGRGVVRTVARFDVTEDLTGVDDAVLEVEQLGGRAGGRAIVVPGAPELAVGDEVVACLEPTPRPGRWRLVALGFSLFDVARGTSGPTAQARGRARLHRRDAALHVLGRPAGVEAARTLDGFRQTVREVRGVRPVRPRRVGGAPATRVPFAVPFTDPSRVDATFTLLGGGIRWNEVDRGATITWYRNLSAPAPVDGSDGEAEIRTALQAWTAAPGATIRLAYGGGRSIGTTSPWCGDANLGAGLITFEDPTNEIGSGVIALGGGCTTAVGRTTVNGTTFDSFTHGFVVLNRSVEVGPGYRSPLNFARIVQHEVGHGIGLGHTPTGIAGAQGNIMYPSCCLAATPVPPALGPDDLAGIRFIYPAPAATGDADGDGLADTWEVQWGLDPASATDADGPDGDPDGDGRTNAQEQADGTHPRGFHRYLLPEGARGEFFLPELAVFVPGPTLARLLFRFDSDRTEFDCRFTQQVAARRTARIVAGQCDGAAWSWTPAAVATFVESDEPLVVERTMSWPQVVAGAPSPTPGVASPAAYGAHAESAATAASPRWWFAEGATHSGFDLFFLIQNVEARPVSVAVTYLRPAPLSPVERTYVVGAGERRTIWVDAEDPGLAATDVATVFAADGGVVVERAMYRSAPGRPYLAGHASRGTDGPATHWWFAEGATGAFFDTFLLVANPGTDEARLRVRYHLWNGETVERPLRVAGRSRANLWVDVEDPALGATEFGIEVESENGVPVVAERAMWWPGPTPADWAEAHATSGATTLARRWITADGEVGGARNASTYLLVLNPSGQPTEARVTLVLDDGATVERVAPLPARSRTTVDVAAWFPEAAGHRFAAEVSVPAGGLGEGIVVERATYWDSTAGRWLAGVALQATPW